MSVAPYMRARRRLVVLFLGLAIVSSATAARAGLAGHEHKPLEPIVLQPRWHLQAPRGVALVAVSGRYVYIGRFTGTASVIDEQTTHAVRLTPPAACSFDTDFAPHTTTVQPVAGAHLRKDRSRWALRRRGEQFE